MLKAQTALLSRNRGVEAVFCGPLASNSENDKDGLKEPQVAEGRCLNDGEILGMMYYVHGATVEAVFEPEKPVEVTSVVSVQAIIYGAVAGALLLILGVVAIYMASMHKHRVTQLFVSFIRGETLLALKILMELIDISGDSNPLPRFLRLHSPSG
jgi:sulfite exporter TauE/SafE